MKTFFLVWNMQNRNQPTVRHNSQGDAEHEASRLARTNPGQSFYVVQAVSCATKTDVIIDRITGVEDDGCPF